jgi:Domain of unknown function (DUF4377)
MRIQTIKPLLLLVFALLVLTPALSTFAQDKDSSAAKEKEVTILVDHHRVTCIDDRFHEFRPRWRYLLGENPYSFPYFYGEIEGFNFQWGHEYRLLALREEAPQSAASHYHYRLVKILSDKKVRPQQTFSMNLKFPLNPSLFDVDKSSNIYLLGEVRIKTINAALRARLLRLREAAGLMDSISGAFRHDQKEGNVITLIDLRYEKQ